MLKDIVIKYYNGDYDLNCAETMIYAANDEYHLSLEKNALKTMAAFGGGMGVEEACGAMTGSLAVLGILFVDDRAHESNKIKDLSKEFIETFKSRLSTENCKMLKDKYRDEKYKCKHIVVVAAEILDEIIERESFRD